MKRAALVGFVLGSLPALAFADGAQKCLDASEHGQLARKDHKLSAARDAFLTCSADGCPGVVRSACTTWLHEVEESMPSIVAVASAPDGTDILGATLLVDGAVTLHAGEANRLDPGPHKITAEADGYEPGETPIVAREGEKNRIVTVKLAKRVARVAPMEDKSERSSPSKPSEHALSPLTWVAGGLTVIALGSFAYFGLRGRSEASNLRDTCAPACSTVNRDSVHTKYLVADLSLLAGLVFGGVTVYTLLDRP